MQGNVKRLFLIGLFGLLLMLAIALNPLSDRSSYAASTWTGVTTSWSNVRTGPSTRDSIVTVDAPGTPVTVYTTVSGQVVWSGISNWYRVSSFSSAPRYIYAALVAPSNSPGGNGGSVSPDARGKEILISLSKQWMYVYDNGHEVYNSPVTSGQPSLQSPTGTYHVFLKLHPTTFYSPWPYGSPYWYPPTHINYALEFLPGYFLHDSWWHSVYGPGTNGWHHDPVDGWQWGSHGCVAMPLSAASWLYQWAPIGTTVQVEG